ncbi:MAG TPA: class I SAM-dependent methyltransferase [Nitrosomonas sp.]|nr:class I SAM-dependent methyltransferase [Nitrosomonas sp.]
MSQKAKNLSKEYDLRFHNTQKYRAEIWKTLCDDYFSRYVSPEHVVLDMGSGWGEFINNINAAYKYAMDLNPDSRSKLNSNVHFLQQDCSQEWDVSEESLDVVFSSNFLEHLPDKTHIEDAINEIHRCLRHAGLAIFLGPNIKYVKGEYWDFWDHFVPLTEQSLAELLRIKGFEVQVNLPRFLPYSMSTGITPPLFLLKMYLRLPFLWRFFGKQFLVVAKKT